VIDDEALQETLEISRTNARSRLFGRARRTSKRAA